MNALVIDNPIYEEIWLERQRQESKWGQQDHPSVDPILTGRNGGATGDRLCQEYEIPSEERAKFLCDTAAKKNVLTWSHILVEEVSEVISAIDDKARREELIQVAAVVVEWIQSIDRKNNGNDRK